MADWQKFHMAVAAKPAQIVCGFLGSEESYNPLIATLPRVLKLDVREGCRATGSKPLCDMPPAN